MNDECRDDSLNQSIWPLKTLRQGGYAVIPVPVHDGPINHIGPVGVGSPGQPWALVSILLISKTFIIMISVPGKFSLDCETGKISLDCETGKMSLDCDTGDETHFTQAGQQPYMMFVTSW